MIKTILWDLDGTLLDTLDDLTDSVNHVIIPAGFPPVTREQVRSYVGNGSRKLMERCMGDPSSPLVDRLHAEYSKYYREHCRVKTAPYALIPELLKKLKDRGVRSCVVSNKPDPQTTLLIDSFFEGLFDFVTGARPELPHKPDPAIVRFVMEKVGAVPESTVFIGDSEIDVLTAENAGVRGAAVSWGFRRADQLEKAGAKTVCRDVGELERFLNAGF